MQGRPLPPLEEFVEIAEQMPLEEKLGRVFLFHLRNLQHGENLLQLNPAGFVRIYSDALTAARQHARLQSLVSYPLLLAADFEKGVAPVVSGGTEFGPAMALAATGKPEITRRVAQAIAREARAIGVNWNLMPTLDVNTDPRNPIINVRAFSDRPADVVEHGRAFVEGSHRGGVLVCLKHFPGHGPTHTDSHMALPRIDLPADELRRTHIAPFEKLIQDGDIDAVMIGHLHCPALESLEIPATFSHRIIEGLLRTELGFEGLVVTDALDMGALTRRFGIEEIVVRAFLAGCDVLLMPADPWEAYSALLHAVRSGTVPKSRLNQAVARVLRFSRSIESLRATARFSLKNLKELATPEHSRLAEEVGRQSVTLIRSNARDVPVSPHARLAVVSFSTTQDGVFEYLAPKVFGDYCEHLSTNCRSLYCGRLGENRYDVADVTSHAIQLSSQAEVIVLAVFSRVVVGLGRAGLSDLERSFIEQVAQLGKPVIVVLFSYPSLAADLPEKIETVVCAYGSGWALQKAAAQALFGHIPFWGTLPVKLA